MNHIKHTFFAKTHPPMYYIHKYWARKPHNVVGEYIEYHSKKGEIVVDPFCGSGLSRCCGFQQEKNSVSNTHFWPNSKTDSFLTKPFFFFSVYLKIIL